MADLAGALFFTYLLSVAFTDEISLNLMPIDRLVTYRQNLNFTELIPDALYNGTITADWAIPNSALSGIESQTIIVKVTASAPENSTIFFPAGGQRANEASVYLQCNVSSGACANGSVLSADIPVALSARQGTKITLRSEIASSLPSTYQALQQDAGSIFESLKKAFLLNPGQNYSEASGGGPMAFGQGLGNLSLPLGAPGNSAQGGNFLDTLKPEGHPQDPLLFLRENPLISIFALIIVIVITGAYLLNAKD